MVGYGKDFLVLRLMVPRWSMNSSKPVMSCGRIWKLQLRLFSTRLGRSGPMALRSSQDGLKSSCSKEAVYAILFHLTLMVFRKYFETFCATHRYQPEVICGPGRMMGLRFSARSPMCWKDLRTWRGNGRRARTPGLAFCQRLRQRPQCLHHP